MYSVRPGWRKLRDRLTGGPQKVRISAKGRVPNIRYFLAIYALLRMLSESFHRKASCFQRDFNDSHHAFIEISTKDIMSFFPRYFNERVHSFVEISMKDIMFS